jgi:hypothetical protein
MLFTRERGRLQPVENVGIKPRKTIVMNWVTLEGVMQGPGHPDEDTRYGFAGALAVS